MKTNKDLSRVILIISILALSFLVSNLEPIGVEDLEGMVIRTYELPQCNDGLDNDKDGKIDLRDNGCKDKRDNDETNCGDRVCSGSENIDTCYFDCKAEAECNDGLDNDGDGVIDMADKGCINIIDDDERDCGDGICQKGENSRTCAEDCGPKTECSDKIDNDFDGRIDLGDVGCRNNRDNDESNCGDGQCEGGENNSTCLLDCGIIDSCIDTDGSLNPDIRGVISGISNGTGFREEDYCISKTNLIEYYCTKALIPSHDNILCPKNPNSTCLDGTCVNLK